MPRSLRRLLVVAVLGGLLWASQRWWRLRTAPPGSTSPATGWPPLPTAPRTPADDPPAAPVTGTAPSGRDEVQERSVEVSATIRATTTRDRRGGVAPVDGGCPDGYEVKAKDRSRIYHLPGMAAYARTSPDRCFRSAEEAEAHGFRRAKH